MIGPLLPKSYASCILLLLDGAKPDVLAQLLAAKKLPNIQKYFVEAGTFQTMLTAFPSTTGPAYLPYLTGQSPGACNIPGIRWFDKNQYAKTGWGFKSFRSYCGFEAGFFAKDCAPDIQTLWEIFPDAVNIFGGVKKGLAAKQDLTKYSRVWRFLQAHQSHNWQRADAFVQKKLMSVLKSSTNTLPKLIFAVFPGVDEYSHLTDPASPATCAAYEAFDKHVGEVFAELDRQGRLQNTLVMVVSDHGHGSVTKHFDIGPWLESHLRLKTFYHSHIFKFKFEAVSMVSGNGMAHLYFKGADGWAGRMRFEELRFKNLLLDELRFHEAVDLIICQDQQNQLQLLSGGGQASLAFDEVEQKFHYAYSGEDPLQIFPKSQNKVSHCLSAEESLAMTFDKAFPDAFVQLWQIFKSPRCGDVVVLAKPGFDLRERYERHEHKSGHGGLQRDHMQVPFLANVPLPKKQWRSVEVFELILEALAVRGRGDH